MANLSNPYPSEEVKRELAEKSKCSIKQVNRKEKKKKKN